MRSPFICIVDDDPIYQYAIGRQIEHCFPQQRTLKFHDAEEALEYLNQNSATPEMLPDVMLIDINMPIMDGWQFMEAYEKLIPVLSKNTKCYIFSSSINPADQLRALGIKSITGFISKPIEDGKLVKIINPVTQAGL
jgi:two-component system, chemotaxis family, chemotaxis protein CheY